MHCGMDAIDGTRRSEPVGVIEELGAGLTGYAVGDRVIVGAITPCGQCNACLAGSLSVPRALAARTGGRPIVFGGLALLAGVGVIVLDRDVLTTGAAVMTCAVRLTGA